MKKIRSWVDTRYNINNEVLECENGVRLLHSINPASQDTVFSAVVRGGSSFEPLLGVPSGSAHFVEHLLDNPDDTLKTQKDVDAFEYGDSSRPRLEVNAGTSKKYIYLYGYCNSAGEERLFERLTLMVGYPTRLFKKYIEKERKVILAEMTQEAKPEKDQEHNYDKFLVGGNLPNFAHRIYGSEKDVRAVTPDELVQYHEGTFLRDNVVFSVQSPGELTASVQEKISEMSALFDGGSEPVPPAEEKIKNMYAYRHFTDEHEHGFFVSFNYFTPVRKRVFYKEKVLFGLMADLLYKLGYNILREELGLIYGFHTFHFAKLGFKHDVRGFKCSAEVQNVLILLDAIHELLYVQLIPFLKSDDGKRWFDNSVSRYVFPHTPKYDIEYAEARALNVLEGNDIYLFEKAVKIARTLVVDDLITYVEEELLSKPPHVWMVSPETDARMTDALERSSVHAHWVGSKRRKV